MPDADSGSPWRDLPTPALLLDRDVLSANVGRMAEVTTKLGAQLRPHFKTSKCLEVARLQRRAGARGFTVATLEEARVLLTASDADELGDVTWAFPVIPSRIGQARDLDRAAGGDRLALTVDTPEGLAALEAAGHPFRVWLEIDSGDHRSGVDPASDRAPALARRLAGSRVLVFAGLLTHGGHSYAARGRAELERVLALERRAVGSLVETLTTEGLWDPERHETSIGSTPTLSVAWGDGGGLDGVDEVRPGNYVFYDFTQAEIGSCKVSDCALTVVATVVSCQPGSGHSVVDAGALALSVDPGPAGPQQGSMGRLLKMDGPPKLRWDAKLVKLSQEHGVIDAELPVGSKVRILPNHSCLTAACWDEYAVVAGDQVVDRWAIHRGRP